MERGLFQIVQASLRSLRRRKRPGQRFTDADIVLVALWAVLHDRSIDWACRGENWPLSRYPRSLPDQSTMSRRLRSPSVTLLVQMVTLALARAFAPCGVAVLDGRALELSRFTRDRHARRGWGRGRFAKGYRLHTLVDASAGRILVHLITPLNVAENVAARVLLTRARDLGLLAPGATIIADANYDSNPLHRHASDLGMRLIAPRRKPGTGLGWSAVGGHHINRLLSIIAMEFNAASTAAITSTRTIVERTFSRQVCTAGGLRDLPAWVRTMPRIRIWVDLKVCLHNLRDTCRLLPSARLVA